MQVASPPLLTPRRFKGHTKVGVVRQVSEVLDFLRGKTLPQGAGGKHGGRGVAEGRSGTGAT